MKNFITKHKTYWSDKQFTTSALIAILSFTSALVIHNMAVVYATGKMSNPVTDLLLDSLPALDVNLIFIEGSIFFWGLVTILLLDKPQSIPFVLKSLAIFLLIRSFFIILTHLGAPENMIDIRSNPVIDTLTFKGDLFFSGHTGAPFLMALIFWKYQYLRLLFLASSIFFAISVLLGHTHYSIDVFGAYFITFGIFHLSLNFFKKDHDLFNMI